MEYQVVDFVKEFFVSGRFVKSINHTFIVLIRKKEEPDGLDDFRPISLCNFCYKVTSNLLPDRIHPILHELISPFKTAFVSRRWIAENCVLAHELISTFKKKKNRRGG